MTVLRFGGQGDKERLQRREFLNYAWLAPMALVTVPGIGTSLWFAFPNFKAGEFGGAFSIGEATGVLSEVNAAPKAYVDGKFWLGLLCRKIKATAIAPIISRKPNSA